MKMHDYPETDSLYIEPEPGTGTREISLGVNIDLDERGESVGLDIDQASHHIELVSLETADLPLRTTRAARAFRRMTTNTIHGHNRTAGR